MFSHKLFISSGIHVAHTNSSSHKMENKRIKKPSLVNHTKDSSLLTLYNKPNFKRSLHGYAFLRTNMYRLLPLNKPPVHFDWWNAKNKKKWKERRCSHLIQGIPAKRLRLFLQFAWTGKNHYPYSIKRAPQIGDNSLIDQTISDIITP